MPTKRQPQKNMKTLKDLFQMELMDVYDAEHRIVKGLARMAKSARSQELQEALQSHLRETEDDVKKLEQVFQAFGMKPKGKKCEGIVGVLEEGDEVAADFKDSPACDAALIAAAQKVEHYEIVTYGTLQEWAELLGNEEASGLLQEILDNEKATNETLTELARASANEEALGETAGVAAGSERSSSSSSESIEEDENMNG